MYLTLVFATWKKHVVRGSCLAWDENEPATRRGAVCAEGIVATDLHLVEFIILTLTHDEQRLDDAAAPARLETKQPACHVHGTI